MPEWRLLMNFLINIRSHWWSKLRSKAADRGITGRAGHPARRDAKTPLPWEGDPARYLSLWSTCQSGVRAVLSFRSNAVFRTCKRCQAANVNAHHWAWECVDQTQREAVAALLRVSPNESNKCLEIEHRRGHVQRQDAERGLLRCLRLHQARLQGAGERLWR